MPQIRGVRPDSIGVWVGLVLLSACQPDHRSEEGRQSIVSVEEQFTTQISEARRLWKDADNSGADRMSAQIIQFPNRVCVQLTFTDGSLGGEPIYCFNDNLEVIYKHEEVE